MRSFKFKITMFLGGFTLLISLIIISILDYSIGNQLTVSALKNLESIGKTVSSNLSQVLKEREREVLLLSKRSELINGQIDQIEVKKMIQLVGETYPHYSWIGVTNPNGIVKNSLNDLLLDKDVSFRPWFEKGKISSYIGDVHKALLLEKYLNQNSKINEPIRFLDFAAPILDEKNNLKGVIATHANWKIASDIVLTSLPKDNALQKIEIFILSTDGTVLYPIRELGKTVLPTNLTKENQSSIMNWEDNQKYLTCYLNNSSEIINSLGWKILVRQSVDKALESVNQIHKIFVSFSILMTILYIIITYRLSLSFSKELEEISNKAEMIASGEKNINLESKSSFKEIEYLSKSLSKMVNSMSNKDNSTL